MQTSSIAAIGKTFIWIVQGFWKKSVEMEVIFKRCWVLEIQNAASTNQSGATTNQIGRSEGLDVTLQRQRW